VGLHQRRQRNGVDLWIVEQVAVIGGGLDSIQAGLNLLEPSARKVADAQEFYIADFNEVADQVRTLIAAAYDPYVNHVSPPSAYTDCQCFGVADIDGHSSPLQALLMDAANSDIGFWPAGRLATMRFSGQDQWPPLRSLASMGFCASLRSGLTTRRTASNPPLPDAGAASGQPLMPGSRQYLLLRHQGQRPATGLDTGMERANRAGLQDPRAEDGTDRHIHGSEAGGASPPAGENQLSMRQWLPKTEEFCVPIQICSPKNKTLSVSGKHQPLQSLPY
jgi:hypothetical protein